MTYELEPAHVHIVSSDVPLHGNTGRKLKRATFRTFVLTSTVPVDQILPPEPNRICAYVQAGGNNVVLSSSKSQAQSTSNTSDVTLANPIGTLLPFGNAAPYPVDTNGEVWAAAASYPTQVTVTAIYEVGE